MGYVYSVRGWLELSWPDEDVEGVSESPEEHAAKIARVRELLTSTLSEDELLDPATPLIERYRAGWAFPASALDGTEYVFFGADVEEPSVVLEQIRAVLAIDPYADGYFSVEGEDGEQYRQWLVVAGQIYARRLLFPDFDVDGAPEGYAPLTASASS